MKGPLKALFHEGLPKISPTWSVFASIWESMNVHEGPLSQISSFCMFRTYMPPLIAPEPGGEGCTLFSENNILSFL